MLFSLKAKEDSQMNTLPFMKDFPNVLPDELLGLPLVREIKFTIDMVFNTGHIT